MISYYLLIALSLFITLKSFVYFLRFKVLIALLISLVFVLNILIASGMYFDINSLNFKNYAPFGGSQYYWTASFLIIFILVTLNNIDRSFRYNQSLTKLVRLESIKDKI